MGPAGDHLPVMLPRSDVNRLAFRVGLGALAALATLGGARPALAQTWAGGRATPSLSELFAVDATGESSWLYGSEDLAGDGLAAFMQQERNIDVRTAYAATDTARLWLRTYISDTSAPGGTVAVYFFIDSDASAATGGGADATEIDPIFTTDITQGGYEFVLGVRGNAALVGLWAWDGSMFADTNPAPMAIDVESGTALDPIRINEDVHGYLQAAVDLADVDLTPQCGATLYVRSVNDTAALGAGDLEVGQVGACVPADRNGNGVPDTVEPPSGCSSDAECPAQGICVAGTCSIAQPCVDANDCPAGNQCTADGRCVPVPAGMCTSTADCGDLVCVGMQCVACTPGGNECAAGTRCSPNGRCVSETPTDGITVLPGQEVQGGACACELGKARSSSKALTLAFALPMLLALRRRRRPRSSTR